MNLPRPEPQPPPQTTKDEHSCTYFNHPDSIRRSYPPMWYCGLSNTTGFRASFLYHYCLIIGSRDYRDVGSSTTRVFWKGRFEAKSWWVRLFILYIWSSNYPVIRHNSSRVVPLLSALYKPAFAAELEHKKWARYRPCCEYFYETSSLSPFFPLPGYPRTPTFISHSLYCTIRMEGMTWVPASLE